MLDRDSTRQVLLSGIAFNLLFAIQVIGGLAFVYITGEVGNRITHFFIPFIWITISMWVIWHTRPTSPRCLSQILAATGSLIYLLILLYLSGLIGLSTPHLEPLTGPSGFGLIWGRTLGWSPSLLYTGDWLTVMIIPYQAIGLIALSYLLYDALLDFARSAIGGIIGIAACPVCVGPLFASMLASGVSGSSLVLFFGRYGYEINTVLFVFAVGVLYYRNEIYIAYQNIKR